MSLPFVSGQVNLVRRYDQQRRQTVIKAQPIAADCAAAGFSRAIAPSTVMRSICSSIILSFGRLLARPMFGRRPRRLSRVSGED